MTDTIKIGGRDIPRTVGGTINRLELIAAEHGQIAIDDVRFLRKRFNELQNQLDDLRNAKASPYADWNPVSGGETFTAGGVITYTVNFGQDTFVSDVATGQASD